MRNRWINPLACAISCLLLAGAAVDRASLAPPIDPTVYHRHISDLSKQVSWNQGNWSAVENVRAERVGEWIHASVFMQLMLTNALSGHSVSLLIEHCDDARDLIPHFPAVCYPAQGMTLVNSQDRNWQLGDLTIKGTEYIFDRSTFQAGGSIAVQNFMILPTGEFCREMNEVKHKLPVADRYVGLAQFQVVMSASVSQAERDQDLQEILLPCHDLIQAMLKGPGAGK